MSIKNQKTKEDHNFSSGNSSILSSKEKKSLLRALENEEESITPQKEERDLGEVLDFCFSGDNSHLPCDSLLKALEINH